MTTPDPALTPEMRAAIREALNEAAPGPWVAHRIDGSLYVVAGRDHRICRCYLSFPCGMENSRLIANAPYWLRALLAEVRRLQAIIDKGLDYEHHSSCGHVWTMRHTACPVCFGELEAEIVQLRGALGYAVPSGTPDEHLPNPLARSIAEERDWLKSEVAMLRASNRAESDRSDMRTAERDRAVAENAQLRADLAARDTEIRKLKSRLTELALEIECHPPEEP